MPHTTRQNPDRPRPTGISGVHRQDERLAAHGPKVPFPGPGVHPRIRPAISRRRSSLLPCVNVRVRSSQPPSAVMRRSEATSRPSTRICDGMKNLFPRELSRRNLRNAHGIIA